MVMAAGTIWVGTARSGLNRFDPATERFTHYRHDPDDPHTLSHDGIAHIHIDRAGRLWILSRDEQAGLNSTYPDMFIGGNVDDCAQDISR